jgi:Xaa-Pro aminopeptidase
MLVNMQKFKELMDKFKLDAVICLSPENVYYLSGFSALEPANTFCAVIITKDQDPVLLTPIYELGNTLSSECWVKDHRYYGEYYIEGIDLNVEVEDAIMSIKSILTELGVDNGRIGIDECYTPFKIYKAISNALPQAQLIDSHKFFEHLRVVKTEEEIRRIREVVKISEIAIMKAYETAGEGVTELEVAKALKESLIRYGANWTFIEMSAGKRSGFPNMKPSDYVMKVGDVFRLDLGTVYGGYCSDISRNAVIGKPSQRQRKVHKALLQGLQRMMEEIRPGVEFSKIFRIGQNVVRKTFPQYQRHHLGHGIGLSTHEKPFIKPNGKGFFRPRMVFTLELPYYIAGFGGFNIEDVFIVTEDGCEAISTIDRSLYTLS